jgi:hypothetical protein
MLLLAVALPVRSWAAEQRLWWVITTCFLRRHLWNAQAVAVKKQNVWVGQGVSPQLPAAVSVAAAAGLLEDIGGDGSFHQTYGPLRAPRQLHCIASAACCYYYSLPASWLRRRAVRAWTVLHSVALAWAKHLQVE